MIQDSLTSRSIGEAYLCYLFVATLVLIPTSNTRLYLRQHLQNL